MSASVLLLPGRVKVPRDEDLDAEGHEADPDAAGEDDEDEEEAEQRDLLLRVVREHEERRVHGELQRKWLVVVVVEEAAWKG